MGDDIETALAEKLFGGFSALVAAVMIANRQFDFWQQANTPDPATTLALLLAGWALWNTGKSK